MADLFTCTGLTKRYGATTDLDDVSLSGAEGRCIALLGHNGAGKTTLIKLLLGLTAPSAGLATIFGRDPRGPGGDQARRLVGYLPEAVAFDPGLNGRDLLRFYAGLKGARRAACDDLLDQVGLGPAGRRPVRTYSKGMRQRLGLAQALIGEPRLLFLDEPTNGLDPPLRREFYDTVKRLTGAGATAVISSHALTEIEAQADLFAILSGGRLVAFGPLQELRQSTGLPVRLRLTVRPGAAAGIARDVGRDFAVAAIDGDAVEFVCDTADKMAIVRRVAHLNGEVRDMDILPPHLDQIYAHFVTRETRP